MVKIGLALAAVVAGCSIPDVTFKSGSGDDDGNPDGRPAIDANPNGNEVIVRWTLNHLSPSGGRSCPSNIATTQILVNVWDPVNVQVSQDVQMFSAVCGAGQQTIKLPAGIYTVHMLIRDSIGTNLAVSDLQYVDSSTSTTVDLKFYDDAGFFALSWDLLDHPGGTRKTCAQAGVPANGWFELISTSSSTGTPYLEKFACDHHVGSTQPLPTGSYTFSARGRSPSGIAVTQVITPTGSSLPPNSLLIFPDIVSVPVAASVAP